MDILIAADIFGHTPALDRLAKKLRGNTLEIMDPYDGKTTFRDEAAAHAFFTARVGIPAYSDKIAARLKTGKPNQTLIGFSVGAAAIWHLSSNPNLSGIRQALCFYGSQIRYQTKIAPVFDVRLFFPSEPHFDVDNLILKLKKIPRVSCQKTEGLHGFMNERSKNFDANLYETCLEQLNSGQFIR
ncbi:MAG: hypothetical protein GY860_19215 [Desulfobacteraceae bacterium]|nr:hypothetical protein [Desulfobacteraceae bacterium]